MSILIDQLLIIRKMLTVKLSVACHHPKAVFSILLSNKCMAGPIVLTLCVILFIQIFSLINFTHYFFSSDPHISLLSFLCPRQPTMVFFKPLDKLEHMLVLMLLDNYILLRWTSKLKAAIGWNQLRGRRRKIPQRLRHGWKVFMILCFECLYSFQTRHRWMRFSQANTWKRRCTVFITLFCLVTQAPHKVQYIRYLLKVLC